MEVYVRWRYEDGVEGMRKSVTQEDLVPPKSVVCHRLRASVSLT